MDFFLYKNRINNLNILYQKEKKKKILISLLFIPITAIFILLLLWGIDGMRLYIIIPNLLLYFILLIIIMLSLLKTNTYKSARDDLIISILNDNGYYFKSSNLRRENIKKAMKTPFVSNSDSVVINHAYEYEYNSQVVEVYNLYCTRSTGKSAITTLSGLVVKANIQTIYNIFIKCNSYSKNGYEVKKFNRINKVNFYKFIPKKEIERIPENMEKIISEFQEKNNCNKIGISFEPDNISFYIEMKNQKIKFKQIDEEYIKKLYDKYINEYNSICNNIDYLRGAINA